MLYFLDDILGFVKASQLNPKTKCFLPCIDTEVVDIGMGQLKNVSDETIRTVGIQILETPKHRCVRAINKSKLDLVGEIINATFYYILVKYNIFQFRSEDYSDYFLVDPLQQFFNFSIFGLYDVFKINT